MNFLSLTHSEQLRYLLVGGVNTVVGYLIGVGTYELLFEHSNIWVVGFAANIMAITFSFVMYKLLVFKTTGNWLREYISCYVVYGAMAMVGVVLLWLFAEKLDLSIWIAQGLVIGCTVSLSYIGHKKFTFKKMG